jgi:predicted acylesterase/phospholipase RssA
MKNVPLRIQLAIQGGGAKICALIAALEAVQLLEKEGVLQVTRIAGTSAGAIAGALFASRVEMAMVKERLGKITSDELARMFPMPTRRHLFWKLIVKQEPLWSSKPLRDLLSRLFGDSGAPSTLQEASKHGIDMRIVASDLSNGQKIVYSGDAPLMNALLDSAGLPFCFRTWTKSGSAVVVDGGICENLPSEELEEFSKKDGPVVGISFVDKERAFVEDIVGFSKSLLNTAMTNSERRARYRLGESVFNI